MFESEHIKKVRPIGGMYLFSSFNLIMTVQIYNMRTDIWTQLPDHTAAREFNRGNFFQYGSELIYFDDLGAIEYKMDTNTWVMDWPDGIQVSRWAYQTGNVFVYQ